jgi:hypothetical protein
VSASEPGSNCTKEVCWVVDDDKRGFPTDKSPNICIRSIYKRLNASVGNSTRLN